ncbi:MAG TPA: chromate resistance protein ChrB domain-containing protein [Candidatus Methanoperedens sp.]|nr:chromate resistance protein ChrB domain-containing protein [Candidatus Methanoperedens sp.]
MAGWLLFFSSLPSKPVGNRVKIWRKLSKSGALQLKGSVYVLPEGGEHREFFQRLVAEVGGMGGEAAFVGTRHVETVADSDIIDLFDRRKAAEYRAIAGALDAATGRIDAARQGGAGAAAKTLAAQLAKLQRDFAAVRRTDFFASAAGQALERRVEEAKAALTALSGLPSGTAAAATVRPRSASEYQGRRWATRQRPFIDRMASAWLVRRFIDGGARFEFLHGDDGAGAELGAVVFDTVGGEFTHVGDLCTFEVLVRAFAIADPAVAQVAEIVHDLDLRDERYRRAEAAGVGGILEGIRRSARDDADALDRGMAVFEALYAALGHDAQSA